MQEEIKVVNKYPIRPKKKKERDQKRQKDTSVGEARIMKNMQKEI